MSEWVLATENPGKIKEFSGLLSAYGIATRSMADFDVQGAEEDGLSFVENAILKARHVAAVTGLPALADDSGLAVRALGGAPGIYSARYAGEHGNDRKNLEKVLEDMDGHSDRHATFVCVLAVVQSATDPLPLIAQGLWEGELLSAPRGEEGFGYDPIFVGQGQHLSAAELSPETKRAISHRGLAVAELKRQMGG